MNTRVLVFGADGGGTKTRGAIAGSEGNVLVDRVAGPTNQNIAGVEGAARELAGLIIGCCEAAGCSTAELRSAVFGLAGAGEEDERQVLAAAVNEQLRISGASPVRITVETDTRIALEGALGGGFGAIVIAGTGSNVMGKSISAEIVTVGGWGRILGDEGSGYRIGLEVLRSATRELDGREKGSMLLDAFSKRFGLKTRQQLINAVYKEKFEIASLAPLALEAASLQDEVAIRILEVAAAELTEQIAAVVSRIGHGVERVPLAFCGGLIENETCYAEILRKSVERKLPNVEIRHAIEPPVQGAILLALATKPRD
jgi:N-acetylglucosamine kinase-like BadF-type ATPase